MTLDVGDVRETVEVTAETPLIAPDKTSISTAVDPRSIRNLPFQDRQFLNLALIVPGTISGTPRARVALTSVETFTVAGMRSQSNNYTLDGISNNDPHVNAPLNLFRMSDAVQEFNVETSIASAEVGRNSGAQVSIITKSGGNACHGNLFYYARNDALDAIPFFLNRAGQPKNPLRRNEFGGTVGGFIYRDKTFWFVSDFTVGASGCANEAARPISAVEGDANLGDGAAHAIVHARPAEGIGPFEAGNAAAAILGMNFQVYGRPAG